MKKGWRHHLFKANGDGTFTPVAWDVPITGATVTVDLSGPSQFEGGIQPEIPHLRDASGEPVVVNWSTVVVSERDGVIKGVFIVKDSPVDEHVMSLTGIGFAGYPNGQYFGAEFKGVKVDPIDQVRRIWDHLQSHVGGDLGVVVDHTKAANNVTIGEEERNVNFETSGGDTVDFDAGPFVLAWYKTDDCGKEIEDLSEYTPFDYRMEHEWSGDSFSSFLRIGSPKLGVRRDRPRFVVGENIIEFPGIERVGDDYANNVLCLGSGEASKMRRGTAKVVSGRLRRAVVVADKAQRSNRAAERVANAELKDRAGDPDVSEVTVIEHPNAPFNTWDLGDDVMVTVGGTWLDTPKPLVPEVVSLNPNNLVVNPGFEDGTAGHYWRSNGVTPSITTANPWEGVQALRVESTGDTSAQTHVATEKMMVSGWVATSIRVRPDAGNAFVQVYQIFYDDTDSFIGSNQVTGGPVPVTGGWQTIMGAVQVPGAATKTATYVYLTNDTGGTPVAGTAFVTDAWHTVTAATETDALAGVEDYSFTTPAYQPPSSPWRKWCRVVSESWDCDKDQLKLTLKKV